MPIYNVISTLLFLLIFLEYIVSLSTNDNKVAGSIPGAYTMINVD